MSSSIYLVLDMENDLVHADGPNGKAAYGEQSRARRIVENTRRALDKARAAALRVGFVRVGFSPDYRECPANSPIFSNARKNGIFKLGEWGTQIHPDLGQQATDFDIVKHRVSPFHGTDLEVILRTHRIAADLLLGDFDQRRGSGCGARGPRPRLRDGAAWRIAVALCRRRNTTARSSRCSDSARSRPPEMWFSSERG